MRFASIDIGSNAVRLLFCNAIPDNGQVVFKKEELIRVPIRLGEDVFMKGRISKKKADKLIVAMKAFRYLMDVYEAVSYRACATAAMREAENRREVIARIKKEAGVQVDLIDGKTEAGIIFSNHVAESLDRRKSYMYIDVGGGSTELTLFSRGKIIASRSFDIGTIRLLHDKVPKLQWNRLKEWISESVSGYSPIVAIGSGGNVNKLYRMAQLKNEKPLSYKKLKSVADMIGQFSVTDRMLLLGLKADRADVIIPASKILLMVMKQAGIEEMLVPQIGLSDGIVHQLYEDFVVKQKKGLKSLQAI